MRNRLFGRDKNVKEMYEWHIEGEGRGMSWV